MGQVARDPGPCRRLRGVAAGGARLHDRAGEHAQRAGALATIRRSRRHAMPGVHHDDDPDADVPLVEIPHVHPDLSSATLLVMDRLDGTPVGDAGRSSRRSPTPRAKPSRRASCA
ncbi:hypothetical protein NKG05_07350 [Oerskovia sp. M15]